MIDFKIFIFILVLCIIGCSTTNPATDATWNMPSKPVARHVNFVQKDDGLYIDKTSSVNLMNNIDDMDVYTEKLEALIKEMKKYYGAK